MYIIILSSIDGAQPEHYVELEDDDGTKNMDAKISRGNLSS